MDICEVYALMKKAGEPLFDDGFPAFMFIKLYAVFML